MKGLALSDFDLQGFKHLHFFMLKVVLLDLVWNRERAEFPYI